MSASPQSSTIESSQPKANRPNATWKLSFPLNTSYECGDYLAILPLNSEKNVKQVMAHFALPGDTVVTINATGPSTIPANTPLSVFDVLRGYVELSQPATRKNLKTLAGHTEVAKDKAYLENLANEDTPLRVRGHPEGNKHLQPFHEISFDQATVRPTFSLFSLFYPPCTCDCTPFLHRHWPILRNAPSHTE